MKKSFITFCILVLYIFAVLFGLGWGILGKNYVTLPITIILGAIALPTFIEACRAVFGDKDSK